MVYEGSTYEYTVYFATKQAYKDLKQHLRGKLEVTQALEHGAGPRKYRAYVYSPVPREQLHDGGVWFTNGKHGQDDIELEHRMVFP